jgi:nuclear pore complex protein Nup98-Nup96
MGILLGIADARNSATRKVLIGNVPERLRGIDIDGISLAQFRRVRRLLVLPDFDEEFVRGVCAAALPLAIWCRSIGICLAKTRFSAWGGPEIQSLSSTMDEDRGGPERSSAADEASPQGSSWEGLGSLEIDGLVIIPDLSRLSARELRQVSELTVSRPEVGSITFHGLTDCSYLDLTRLVHLDIGEVLVYPEPGSKAPIGQGLNKRSTVTMYQCWPPNGRGHLEDEIAQERYRYKIQQMTEEKRAKFIDYDCNTGVWKFQVEHF